MYIVKVINCLTPETYKKLDQFEIIYGYYETRFEKCLIGLYNNTLCYISFKTEAEISDLFSHLKQCFPGANFLENDSKVREFANDLFNDEILRSVPVKVTLFGTEFQIDVWKALIQIKEGSTASYEDIARNIGKPRAIRAVANAIANNKIAYVIPCHRVIRKNGLYVGKYRWGVERKTKMLEYEGVCNLK